MQFRLWYYGNKAAMIGMLLSAGALIVLPHHKVLVVISLAVFGASFLVGAALAIATTFGNITCPFCKRPGALQAKGEPGFSCPGCGYIHGTGVLGLRFVREEATPKNSLALGGLFHDDTALFPAAWRYLRDWRTARYFLLMLFPLAAGAGRLFLQGKWSPATMLLLFGSICLAFTYVSILTGKVSVNGATFTREGRPGKFWSNVFITGALYAAITIATWLT